MSDNFLWDDFDFEEDENDYSIKEELTNRHDKKSGSQKPCGGLFSLLFGSSITSSPQKSGFLLAGDDLNVTMTAMTE